MATTNDDLTWSEDVLTLEQVILSRTLPIIVRVEGGSYGNQESESLSRGDIFKLDSAEGNEVIGYCYKDILHKRENVSEDDHIPYKQIVFNKETAETIDVVVCLTKCDEVKMPFVSTNVPPKPAPSHAYVDFTLPVPSQRTSPEFKQTPPPIPPRGKDIMKSADEERKPMPPTRKPSTPSLSDDEKKPTPPPLRKTSTPSLSDEERKPMPPPRKLSTPSLSAEHSQSDMQGTLPRVKEIPSTLEEECPEDVYEISYEDPDNIYDEPDNLQLPTSPTSQEQSLKQKTKEFFSKLHFKEKMRKFKSKLETAIKMEKTVTANDVNSYVKGDVKDEEVDEDSDYEYPEDKSTKMLNDKQSNNDTDNRYDMLEKRLMVEKPPGNTYTPLSVGGAAQADTSFRSLSINGLANRLIKCGLTNLAEICREEKVDGRLFFTFTDDDLRQVFSVNELQIKKIRMAQNHDWTPKT